MNPLDEDVLFQMTNDATGRTVCVIPVQDFLLPNDGSAFQVLPTLDPTRVMVIVSREMMVGWELDVGRDAAMEWVVESSILAAQDYFTVAEI